MDDSWDTGIFNVKIYRGDMTNLVVLLMEVEIEPVPCEVLDHNSESPWITLKGPN
jgi:hypothetical protein